MDLKLINHGSVATVVPLSPAGQEWLAENVEAEGWQNFAGGIAMEPRFAIDVMNGAIGDGLEVA
jgi:hypothetical protein